jgi:PPOX class probable F420-dependent enzyme
MSRRDQIRMTDQEITDFLETKRTVVLNSIGADGAPHPMPMWFAIEEDGAIVMTTFTKSQKILNIQRNPIVSLLAEDGHEYDQLRAVVYTAKAELVEGVGPVADILMAISTRNGTNPVDIDPKDLRAGIEQRAEKRSGIRVRPDKVVSWDHRKLGGKY